jgi:hypothetical protein
LSLRCLGGLDDSHRLLAEKISLSLSVMHQAKLVPTREAGKRKQLPSGG